MFFIYFSDLMNSPALSLNKVERVGRIVEILRNETFCGFPVVNHNGKVNHSQLYQNSLKLQHVKANIV